MHVADSYRIMPKVELLVGLGPLSFGFSYTYPCASISASALRLIYSYQDRWFKVALYTSLYYSYINYSTK